MTRLKGRPRKSDTVSDFVTTEQAAARLGCSVGSFSVINKSTEVLVLERSI